MSSKPTLVFIPGAWHTASTWDKVTTILTAQGYKCISVTLPSASSNADATFLNDLTAARGPIVSEISQGRDVVVVMHSYGGVVGVSAIKGLTVPKDDSEDKKSGHVIGIAMIATGFMPTGISFLNAGGGKPPPFWKIENGFAELTVDPQQFFYHDLPDTEGKEWVSKLQKQSLKALAEGDEHVYAGWMDVPVWFLATIQDVGLPIAMQRMFIPMAKEAGADVTLREVDSSHSPMLSKPKETIEFLEEAVAAFVK